MTDHAAPAYTTADLRAMAAHNPSSIDRRMAATLLAMQEDIAVWRYRTVSLERDALDDFRTLGDFRGRISRVEADIERVEAPLADLAARVEGHAADIARIIEAVPQAGVTKQERPPLIIADDCRNCGASSGHHGACFLAEKPGPPKWLPLPPPACHECGEPIHELAGGECSICNETVHWRCDSKHEAACWVAP